ncbi:MAG: hypothetical protein BZ138_08320, partial [Methanosphaera sp. rholeuAM270]
RKSLFDAVTTRLDLAGNGRVDADELISCLHTRILLAVEDAGKLPQLILLEGNEYDGVGGGDGGEAAIVFPNASGTAYYQPYSEYVVPIVDKDDISDEEIRQAFAKAGRLVYDLT